MFGYTGIDLPFESSWYSAPYIERMPELTHVIHVVRNPSRVVASFYRIGLCSKLPFRHITAGHAYRFLARAMRDPGRAVRRTRFVLAHRRFLKKHTTCFAGTEELDRLFTYWTEWNKMVEASAAHAHVRYLRVRLEEPDTLREISDFLGLENTLRSSAPTNTKTVYRARPLKKTYVPPQAQRLAERYGYSM